MPGWRPTSEALLTVHRRLDAEQFLAGETRTPPAEAVRAGMTLGAYTLVGPIGRGGMSAAYAARRAAMDASKAERPSSC